MLSLKNYTQIFLFLWASFSSFGQDKGAVIGTVSDGEGRPLEGVEFSIKELEIGTISDTDGKYRLENISVGRFTLTVSAIGYQEEERVVSVKSGDLNLLDIVLVALPFDLGEITIKGGNLTARNRTTTVNTIRLAEIKQLNISTPQDLLYQIPGVERTDLGQGGAVSQIGMRGFELGGHGGDLAMEVDGISFNETEHSGGYVDMNILIPLNIAQLQVYKGPSSPLFGLFARGGALSFETRKGGNYQDVLLTGGSYESFDGQLALGNEFKIGAEKFLKTNIAAQVTRSKGYTVNADYEKANINGRVAYRLSEKTEVALSLMGHTSTWDAPGFITEEMLKDEHLRKQQAKNGENDGGKQVFASERLEVNHTIEEHLKVLLYGYSIQQSQTRYSKFGMEPGPGQQTDVTHARNTYAVGGSLNGHHELFDHPINWVVGTEFYNEFTDRTGYSSFNRLVEQGAKPYQKNAYRLQSFSVYGQGEWVVSSYFRPSIGFRYESFDGRLNNRLDHTHLPLQNLAHLSPKFGIRSTIFKGLDFRISATNGYTLPGGDGKYAHDKKIDPEELWQYEIGFNYAFPRWIQFDVSAYTIRNSSEKTYVHGSEDLYIDSGKTRRRGIEMSAESSPAKALHFKGSFTYQRTKIKSLSDTPEMEGNELTNLPRTISILAMDYTLKNGLGAEMRYRNSGKYATNRINTNYYGGYSVADVKVFYDFGKTRAANGRIFVEVKNLFNENYATYALDFEHEFGIPGGVFYAPAPLRNFTIGVRYSL